MQTKKITQTKKTGCKQKDRMQTKNQSLSRCKLQPRPADSVTGNVLQTSNYDPEVMIDLADGPNWPRLYEI